MPGFITDAQLFAVLAPVLHKANVDLQANQGFWAAIVTAANNSAYGEIAGRLAERAYSSAQVAGWDRGAEFQTQIGLYLALSMGAANQPEGYRDGMLRVLDYRPQLKDVSVLVSGKFVYPDGTDGSQGLVGTGKLADCNFPDPINPDCQGDLDIGKLHW
jgi:hypothetical protein